VRATTPTGPSGGWVRKAYLVARLSASPQSLPQVEDGYLIALAKQGHADAYDRIVRRYYGFVRLKASSYFLAGGDADDLIQEGLVGLYKAVRDYRTDRESSFRNFAELCITRQIITAVKTSTRNKHAPLNQYISFSSTPAGASADGEPTLFHTGDMIDTTPDGVDVVAVPLNAPWCAAKETVTFLRALAAPLRTRVASATSLVRRTASRLLISIGTSTNSQSTTSEIQRRDCGTLGMSPAPFTVRLGPCSARPSQARRGKADRAITHL